MKKINIHILLKSIKEKSEMSDEVDQLGKEVKLIYKNGVGEAIAYLFFVIAATLLAIFGGLDSLGLLMVGIVVVLFGGAALLVFIKRNNQAIEFENGIYYRKGKKEVALLFDDIKEVQYKKRFIFMKYMVSMYSVPAIVMNDNKTYVFPIMVDQAVQTIFNSYVRA